jgi:trans-aconitate 2-methyltransferase
MPVWDPQQYSRYASERNRPFFELIARIPVADPARVADLGCGDGSLTATLADRWPGAVIEGIDSSAEMLDRAPQRPGLSFSVGDINEWRAEKPVDVLVSNAALQWVDGHLDLLPHLLDQVSTGGCLAFQVPGNFDAPSHAILAEIRRSPKWRAKLGDSAVRLGSHDPAAYLDKLAQAGCTVDCWETTYLQVLPGSDPVLEWVKGTALRPVLSLLDAAETAEFIDEYGTALRIAYPCRAYGTVFPFRRIFAVARKSS